jgi:hypothetical protein
MINSLNKSNLQIDKFDGRVIIKDINLSKINYNLPDKI